MLGMTIKDHVVSFFSSIFFCLFYCKYYENQAECHGQEKPILPALLDIAKTACENQNPLIGQEHRA